MVAQGQLRGPNASTHDGKDDAEIQYADRLASTEELRQRGLAMQTMEPGQLAMLRAKDIAQRVIDHRPQLFPLLAICGTCGQILRRSVCHGDVVAIIGPWAHLVEADGPEPDHLVTQIQFPPD